MRALVHGLARGVWLGALALALSACGSDGDSVDPSLQVAGDVARPALYSRTRLASFAQTTQQVSYLSGTTPETHTYVGPSAWSVLNDASINVDASKHNDMLNRYVLATGGDGYQAVFSTGELSPDFGARPDLIAIQEVVAGAPASLDGSFRITSPGDVKGGRYVSGLKRLDVRATGSTLAGQGGGLSTSFVVTGPSVLKSLSFDAASLAALPAVTQTVGGNAYTGASLWSVLSAAGLATRVGVKNDSLGMYVVATGSDGYKVAVAIGEVDPSFGNQPALIAYQLNGGDLGKNGFARLVMPNDVKAGRWMSNLIGLEVFTAPAAN